MNEHKDLIDLIASGESQNREFKQDFDSKSVREKILKTAIAFANTAGGKILIGVEDQTLNIVGISAERLPHIVDDISNAISDDCTPHIAHSINLVPIGDKTIVELDIYPGNDTPYYLKSKTPETGTFVRVNSTTRQADEYWVKELQFVGVRRSFDQQLVRGTSYLSATEIEAFCEMLHQEALKNAEGQDIRPIKLQTLISWGVVSQNGDKIFPTHAFYLLRGDHPIFKTASILCARFPSNDRSTFLDRKAFNGSLFEQFHHAFDWIQGILQMRSAIIGKSRTDFFELPLEAIREVLTNALCHRSYLYDGASIKVSVFPDRLEFSSPGPLPTSISLNKLMLGYTFFRNPAIAAAFKYVGLIGEWPSGLPRARRLMAIWGLPDPEAEDLGAAIVIRLRRPDDAWPNPVTQKAILDFQRHGTEALPQAPLRPMKTQSLDALVLQHLREDPTLSINALADTLHTSAGTIRGVMTKLKREGKLVRIGQRQTGLWQVIDPE